MKYIVIGSETQVAAVDYKSNLNLMRECAAPFRFSNINPATGERWIARVAANQVWNTRKDAELFKTRCESALAYLSGRLGRWLTPTFVVVPVMARVIYGIQRARRMKTDSTAQCRHHHQLCKKIEAELGYKLPL